MDLARDTAIVNIPLSKRGNIDNQIDRYKYEQKKIEKVKSIEIKEQFKSDKKMAKDLYLTNKDAMKLKYGKNIVALEDWVKWQPAKAIKFIKMFEDGK